MKLLKPRFPHSVGGRSISFLRIVMRPNGSLVVKVTDRIRKEGEAIASCTVEEKLVDECYQFITMVEDTGHRELCCLLRENGIRGTYREWLEAVENGDESQTGDKRHLSGICFECDLIDGDEAAGWKFKLREEFAETEINL